MSEFRLKKLPRDEESMKEIIEEISRREEEGEAGGEEGHVEEEEHSHGHGHEHEDLAHEQLHIMEHILAQLSQLDARLAGIDRSLSELSLKLDEIIKLSRALVKVSLASIVDNRDARKKLIEDVMEEI